MLRNHLRVATLISMFLILLASDKIITSKLMSLGTTYTPMAWATGTAIIVAIILTIAYDQRFSIGMSIFYCTLACLVAEPMGVENPYQIVNIDLFLIMMKFHW